MAWTTFNNQQQRQNIINNNSNNNNNNHLPKAISSQGDDDGVSRRQVFVNLSSKAMMSSLVLLLPSAISPAPANAYDRQVDKVSYTIDIPTTMQQSSKPVKTHQDEVNFKSEDIKGYQYGITVDPVRINSL